MSSESSGSNAKKIDCYGSAYWFRDIKQGMEAVVDVVFDQ
jgi:hypothetical protein